MCTRTPRRSYRYRFFQTLLACSLLLTLPFISDTALAINGEIDIGGRYTDKLSVCSFKPPEGWVLWDYYGLDVFSPPENRDIRLSLIAVESVEEALLAETPDEGTATDPNEPSSPFLKREVKGFENTFSEPDFEILSLEKREIAGYPGVEVSH